MLDATSNRGPAHVMASPMDWSLYAAKASESVRRLVDELVQQKRSAVEPATTPAPDEAVDSMARRLEEATPTTRKALLTDFVCGSVVKVLGRQAGDELDMRRPLSEMGLDSLLAVELRNRLSRGLVTAARPSRDPRIRVSDR